MEEILNEIYYSTKEGYTRAKPLLEKAKLKEPNIMKGVKLKQVQEWLDNQPVYQIHKEKTQRKNYLPIFSRTRHSYQIDLTFLPKFKQINRGYQILLTAINVNTRKGYAYKMKKKSDIYDVIQQFIEDAKPKTITSDNGSEFINKKVTSLFEKNDIKYYLVEAGDKNSVGMIERFNRTLKDRLNKYFTHIEKPIWYDIIDDIVENYNNTTHSSIEKTPNTVTPQDEERFIKENIAKSNAILQSRPVIYVGDYVRLPLKKKLFDKGEPKYSSAVYVVNYVNDIGNEIQVSGRKDTFKHEDVLVVSKPINIDDSKIKEVKKKEKVKRDLKKAGVEEVNITREKRVIKRPVKLDL